MFIHQIFWDFYNKGMNNLFIESKTRFQSWSLKNGYEYILWDKDNCDLLIKEYPNYEPMYKEARYDIMRIDIIRLLILHKYGGLYADLDVFPNIKKLKDTKLKFVFDKTNSNRINNVQYITNEILQMPKRHKFPLDYLDYVDKQIKEKNNVDVYKIWKMRYVLQTTGPQSLTRFVKSYKYPYGFYTCNQLVYKDKGKWDNLISLGDTSNVDFITHSSQSWANL